MVTLKYRDGEYWLTVGNTIHIYDLDGIKSVLKECIKKPELWIEFSKHNEGIDTIVI